MGKKELKVGETFTAGFIRLKCVEGDTYDGCIFEDYDSCSCTDIIIGSCGHIDRQDGKNVIFIKAD
jgi:hypothetical protein